MPVDSTHQQYNKYLPHWQMLRDCFSGADAVKKRTKGDFGENGTAYLPAPNPDDVSSENKKRYRDYRDRALYVNYVSNTVNGLSGMVFRKPSNIELPSQVDYLDVNADGRGLPLEQLLKEVLTEVMTIGRIGLLVDYPDTPEELTLSQSVGVQARITRYCAEDIINWRTTVVDGKDVIAMVVLKELVDKPGQDDFEVEPTVQYRVLRMLEGVYIQQLYNEDGILISDDIVPRMSDGSVWSEIPFVFVGSTNNDTDVDVSPVYDIAHVNIGHYRNSADYEESCYMAGQPTPVLTGLTMSWIEQVMPRGVMLGSRTAIPLPEGGGAALLQANPNPMPREAMLDKEKQMIQIGARIIQDSSGNETAEAARIRFAGQNSKLAMIVGNVEEAFWKAIYWCGCFMGSRYEGFELEINREFYDATVDPQMIMASLQLADRGLIADNDVRYLLRRGNIIDSGRTDEDIEDEAEQADPLNEF